MSYHLFEGSFLGIFLSKILLPFLKIPYLKTDVTSLLTLFFVKNLEPVEKVSHLLFSPFFMDLFS